MLVMALKMATDACSRICHERQSVRLPQPKLNTEPRSEYAIQTFAGIYPGTHQITGVLTRGQSTPAQQPHLMQAMDLC